MNHDIRQFDNQFFGINNREAADMDPQQRKLLEVVFECFESAGYSLDEISGAQIGCYGMLMFNQFPSPSEVQELYYDDTCTCLNPCSTPLSEPVLTF